MTIKARLKRVEIKSGATSGRGFSFQISRNTDVEEMLETFCKKNNVVITPADTFMFFRLAYGDRELSPDEAAFWELSNCWLNCEDIAESFQYREGITKFDPNIVNPCVWHFSPKQTYSF